MRRPVQSPPSIDSIFLVINNFADDALANFNGQGPTMRYLPLSSATLLLIAAALGCGAAKRGPAEPCSATADCADALVCTANQCTAPGMCPAKAPVDCGDGSCCPADHRACCSDGNCYATGEDCRAATCVGTGSPCTSSKYCCTGLTCQLGRCALPPTTMTWSITNNCFTGGTVAYRFFDRTTDAAVPVTTIATIGAGRSATAMVSCRTGAKICFGGRDQSDGTYYGVDIDGTQGCDGCCNTCASTSVTLPPLSCP